MLLDTGPTGLLISPSAKALHGQCWTWLVQLESTSVEVLLPTIVDFEIRRELLRIGATANLRALDELRGRLGVVDVGSSAFLRAAEFWAIVRKAGKPTAHPEALDADTIIAGIASEIGEAWDEVIIATNNTDHFSRFPGINAREWRAIG